MKARFVALSLVVATALVWAAPLVQAQDGVQGALERASRTWSLRPLDRVAGLKLAVADFDNDTKPDGAVLVESVPLLGPGTFQIEVHFTSRSNSAITFQSPESDLTLTALDIDHDGDVDILVEQSFTHKRLQVWLNDGHGNFEKGRIEDFPLADLSYGKLASSPRAMESPTLIIPTPRGFETLPITWHVAGRPPSNPRTAVLPANLFKLDHVFSAASSRAPPLS